MRTSSEDTQSFVELEVPGTNADSFSPPPSYSQLEEQGQRIDQVNTSGPQEPEVNSEPLPSYATYAQTQARQTGQENTTPTVIAIPVGQDNNYSM